MTRSPGKTPPEEHLASWLRCTTQSQHVTNEIVGTSMMPTSRDGGAKTHRLLEDPSTSSSDSDDKGDASGVADAMMSKARVMDVCWETKLIAKYIDSLGLHTHAKGESQSTCQLCVQYENAS